MVMTWHSFGFVDSVKYLQTILKLG
jgi:hypothetical protein